MAAPLSQDLRDRVIDAVLGGMSRSGAARRFGVGKSSAIRWVSAACTENRRTPLPMGGNRRRDFAEHREALLKIVDERADRTIDEISAELARQGMAVSHGTVFNWLARIGLTFKKKTLFASEQKRADVAKRREQWPQTCAKLDPRKLVFIDETWAKTNMTRRHGRSRKGQRLIGYAPHGHWKTTTFIAALRFDNLGAPMVLDGPINGNVFTEYVSQVLAPTLTPGDIVVLDNLSSHKRKEAHRIIREKGASLLFLPPYSPELNPIEMVFSKIKALLREAQERTVEALWQKIGTLIEKITPDECVNYFRHAGYDPT